MYEMRVPYIMLSSNFSLLLNPGVSQKEIYCSDVTKFPVNIIGILVPIWLMPNWVIGLSNSIFVNSLFPIFSFISLAWQPSKEFIAELFPTPVFPNIKNILF